MQAYESSIIPTRSCSNLKSKVQSPKSTLDLNQRGEVSSLRTKMEQEQSNRKDCQRRVQLLEGSDLQSRPKEELWSACETLTTSLALVHKDTVGLRARVRAKG